MKKPFTNIFLILIDEVLKEDYNNPVPRKDYLTFFLMFERRLSMNLFEGFESVEINNHAQRTSWGQIRRGKSLRWKFDIIIQTLLDRNILTQTGYINNKHSRRYSYSQSLLNAIDYSNFEIVYEEVNEKIYSLFKKLKTYDKNDPQYQLLKSDRFSINVDLCNDWLIENYKSDKISKDKCLLNIRRVSDINSKDIYSVKISNGRVYNSFSSLKKELRQFCFIDNQPLTSVDLKSSQPYLFSSYLLSKYPKSIGVKKFYNIVTEDDIYTWIMLKYNEIYPNKLLSREETKPEFYRYLFKRTNKGTNPVQEIIETNFPDLYEIVKQERNLLIKEDNTIPNQLQTIEAEIFVKTCEEFALKGCLSVHDSLCFKEELRGEIETSLKGKFQERNLKKYTLKEEKIIK